MFIVAVAVVPRLVGQVRLLALGNRLLHLELEPTVSTRQPCISLVLAPHLNAVPRRILLLLDTWLSGGVQELGR